MAQLGEKRIFGADDQDAPSAVLNADSAPDNESLLSIGHLDRQTFSDQMLQRQVLEVFHKQLGAALDRLPDADFEERRALAHLVRGSSNGVGALLLVERCAALEENPSDSARLAACRVVMAQTMASVADFIASLS